MDLAGPQPGGDGNDVQSMQAIAHTFGVGATSVERHVKLQEVKPHSLAKNTKQEG